MSEFKLTSKGQVFTFSCSCDFLHLSISRPGVTWLSCCHVGHKKHCGFHRAVRWFPVLHAKRWALAFTLHFIELEIQDWAVKAQEIPLESASKASHNVLYLQFLYPTLFWILLFTLWLIYNTWVYLPKIVNFLGCGYISAGKMSNFVKNQTVMARQLGQSLSKFAVVST